MCVTISILYKIDLCIHSHTDENKMNITLDCVIVILEIQNIFIYSNKKNALNILLSHLMQ